MYSTSGGSTTTLEVAIGLCLRLMLSLALIGTEAMLLYRAADLTLDRC